VFLILLFQKSGHSFGITHEDGVDKDQEEEMVEACETKGEHSK